MISSLDLVDHTLPLQRPKPPHSITPPNCDCRITQNRDLVREVIEESILPDLLDAADRLAARGLTVGVTVSDPEGFSAASPVAAWVKLKVHDPKAKATAVLAFHGVAQSHGWSVEARVQINGRPSTIDACHRLDLIRSFTRSRLALLPLGPGKQEDSKLHLAR